MKLPTPHLIEFAARNHAALLTVRLSPEIVADMIKTDGSLGAASARSAVKIAEALCARLGLKAWEDEP